MLIIKKSHISIVNFKINIYQYDSSKNTLNDLSESRKSFQQDPGVNFHTRENVLR